MTKHIQKLITPTNPKTMILTVHVQNLHLAYNKSKDRLKLLIMTILKHITMISCSLKLVALELIEVFVATAMRTLKLIKVVKAIVKPSQFTNHKYQKKMNLMVA